MRKNRIFRLVSLYIDKETDEKTLKIIEEKIASDKEWYNIYIELTRLKKMIREIPDLPENPDLSLIPKESAKKKKLDFLSFLPVPRHLAPAALLLLVTAILIFILLIFQRSRSIESFFVENANAVRNLYASNFVRGDLYPATTALNNDDILKFALNGIIPINNSKDKIFKFVEDNKNGYYFDICRQPEAEDIKINTAGFYQDLHLNEHQKYRLDSVLTTYRTNIETSLLVSSKKYMAIDANLWNIKQALIYDLSKNMNITQRREFTTYIRHDKDKYILENSYDPRIENSIKKYREKSSGENHFIVLSSDSIQICNINVNFDSIRNNSERHLAFIDETASEKENIITTLIQIHKPRENIFHIKSGKYDSKGKHSMVKNSEQHDVGIAVWTDSNSCRVEISKFNRKLPKDFFIEVKELRHMEKLKDLENLRKFKEIENLKNLEHLGDLETAARVTGVRVMKQIKSLQNLFNTHNSIIPALTPIFEDSLPNYFNNIKISIDSAFNNEIKKHLNKGLKIFPKQNRIKVFPGDSIHYIKRNN